MWLLFTLITTLLWGFAELFYKKGARPEERYAHLKICVCVGTVMGLHALFVLLTQDIHYNPVNLIHYLPVSFCYILSMTFSFFGMRFIEESISDPIENTSGAMCSVLCVAALGETIAFGAVIAILITVVGILGIGFLEHSGTTDRRKRIGKRMAVIAFSMPFCYAILDALGSFLDIYYLGIETSPLVGVNGDTIEMVANTSYELTFAFCGLVLFLFMRVKKVPFELPKQRNKILAALCETGGQFTYVFAMSGNGAIAAPILSSVCVVSLLLSRIELKERLTRRQYFFVFLVVIGVILLAVVEGE